MQVEPTRRVVIDETLITTKLTRLLTATVAATGCALAPPWAVWVHGPFITGSRNHRFHQGNFSLTMASLGG